MPMSRVPRWMARRYGAAAAQWSPRLLTAWHALGNLLFPPACVFCGQELISPEPGRPLLCGRCVGRLTTRSRSACQRCASPLPKYWPHEGRCPKCQGRRYFFHRSTALGYYRNEMQQAVLRMKRPNFEPLTHAMGLLLADEVRVLCRDVPVDLVVPVPMHWWRRLRRGTSPAQTLALTVGRSLALAVSTRLLRCRRKASKQGTLRPSERFKNVRDAFCVSSAYDITDANILLIDDIMTTGATASEAARLLRQAGARAVCVAVVARGVGNA
ncbi:MAG: double zinc ribbon domain-containing protein [Pirellulaceae bacterium]